MTSFEEWMKKQDPAIIKDVFSAAAGWKAAQDAMSDGKTIYVPQHVYDMLRDILVTPKELIKALKKVPEEE